MPTWGIIALAALYLTYFATLILVFVWLYREYHPRATTTQTRSAQPRPRADSLGAGLEANRRSFVAYGQPQATGAIYRDLPLHHRRGR